MTNTALPFAPGDPVHILDGPLATFAGVVRAVDAALGELVVDVEMYGRPVPIRTHPWQVAPARSRSGVQQGSGPRTTKPRIDD